MAILFSAATGGFYDTDVHAVIPAGAVPVTDARWLELIEGQEAGFEIVADQNGDPQLVQPSPPTAAQLRASRSLTKLQLAITAQRPAYGFMTTTEADEWLGLGTIPAVAADILATLPAGAVRDEATLRFKGATDFPQLDPFMLMLKDHLGLTDAQMDAFFIEGAQV